MNNRKHIRQIKHLRTHLKHLLQDPLKRAGMAKKFALYMMMRLLLFIPSSASTLQQKHDLQVLEHQVKHQQELTIETAQRVNNIAYSIERELEQRKI